MAREKRARYGAPEFVAGKIFEVYFSRRGFTALALPALKRMIKVTTLSRRAKALLPPHKCGGFHHESHGFPALTQTL
jgi:hypothetical protein